jgi:hypothetical protein
VTAGTGAFRAQAYEAPVSAALTDDGRAINAVPTGSAATGKPDSLPVQGRNITSLLNLNPGQLTNQAALDKFREKSKAGKVAGILPIRVAFPAVGPSLFLVSELTAENQAPNAELSYQREKKSEKKAGGK